MADHINGNSDSPVKLPTIKFTRLFINGEFVDSVSGKTFETIDPRTGEVICRVPIPFSVISCRLFLSNAALVGSWLEAGWRDCRSSLR